MKWEKKLEGIVFLKVSEESILRSRNGIFVVNVIDGLIVFSNVEFILLVIIGREVLGSMVGVKVIYLKMMMFNIF